MDQEHLERPSVVPSSSIPVSAAPEDHGLEVRPFLAHDLLRHVIPRAGVSLAWTNANHEQEVLGRSHPVPSLLVVLRGRAVLLGERRGAIEQGDVITVPSHHEYGLTEIGVEGIQILHVKFDKADPTELEEITLEQLLEHNETRGHIILCNPFFELLRTRQLKSARARDALRQCLRVFADAFQVLLFTRQALCRDDEFRDTFNEHLLEEIGHNKLLNTAAERISRDPILVATSSWFCHQMIAQDNVSKAVINLVLETAGYYLGMLGGPLFAGDDGEKYFDTHAEGDAHHREVAVHLLEGQHSDTYRRLFGVLDEAWDMLEAVTRRIVLIVEAESATTLS